MPIWSKNIFAIWQILERRKLFIVLFTGSIMLLTFIYLLSAKRTYEAMTVIRISQLASPESGIQPPSSIYEKMSLLETHRNMLLSRAVLDRLINALPILRPWEKLSGPANKSLPASAQLKQLQREQMIKKLRKIIRLNAIQFTDILEVIVHFDNKQQVAAIANTLIRVYREWLNMENERQYQTMAQFLQQRVVLVKQRLELAEENMRQYEQQHSLGSLQDDIQEKVAIITQLGNQLIDITTKINFSQDMVKKIAADPNTLLAYVGLTDNEAIREFAQTYDQVDMQFNLSTQYLKPNHPKYIELERRRQTLQKKLQSRLSEYFQAEALKLQLERTRKQEEIEKYRKQLYALQEKNQVMAKLRRELKASEEMYFRLLTRLDESELLQAKQSLVDVTVISPAVEPIKHILPKRKRIMIMATVFSFLMALAIVFLDEKRKHFKWK